MSPRKSALAIVASALVLSACGSGTGIIAQLSTVESAYTVFALTGTSASSPSGLNTYVQSTELVDGLANFDVAFDLDQAGNVLIYPVQKVVSSVNGTHQVGMRRVAGTFDAVTIAPTGNYFDSTFVVKKGEVVVIQSLRNGINDACQFDISPYIYSKLGVDSVALDSRSIFVSVVLDPNCGFRSFATGIPTI